MTPIDNRTLENLPAAGGVKVVTTEWRDGGWRILIQFDRTVGALSFDDGDACRNERAVSIGRPDEQMECYTSELGLSLRKQLSVTD